MGMIAIFACKSNQIFVWQWPLHCPAMASSLSGNPGEILNANSNARFSHLTPHRNAHDIAPLPDRLVMQAIDGFVLPH